MRLNTALRQCSATHPEHESVSAKLENYLRDSSQASLSVASNGDQEENCVSRDRSRAEGNPDESSDREQRP
jgi:hypothetical protein